MKLKTLKDIEKIEKDYEFVYSQELKQEAIKWIKEDIENFNLFEEASKWDAESLKDMKSGRLMEAIDFTQRWMKRLNITKEDLK